MKVHEINKEVNHLVFTNNKISENERIEPGIKIKKKVHDVSHALGENRFQQKELDYTLRRERICWNFLNQVNLGSLKLEEPPSRNGSKIRMGNKKKGQ